MTKPPWLHATNPAAKPPPGSWSTQAPLPMLVAGLSQEAQHVGPFHHGSKPKVPCDAKHWTMLTLLLMHTKTYIYIYMCIDTYVYHMYMHIHIYTYMTCQVCEYVRVSSQKPSSLTIEIAGNSLQAWLSALDRWRWFGSWGSNFTTRQIPRGQCSFCIQDSLVNLFE